MNHHQVHHIHGLTNLSVISPSTLNLTHPDSIYSIETVLSPTVTLSPSLRTTFSAESSNSIVSLSQQIST